MTIKIVPRGTILKYSFQIIIGSAIIQSVIGIWQFISQTSLGLFWLKEGFIRPDILGVAKIIVHGEKIIRSYGLFPHPNVFGGFLLFSLMLTYLYQKMFHVEQLDNNSSTKCSTWNNNTCETYNPIKNVPRGTFFLNIDWSFKFIFTIQLIALLLTFSKSAIIGLVVSCTYIFINKYVPRGTKFRDISKIVPRGTILSKKPLLILLILATSLILFKPDMHSFFLKSLDERTIYLNVSRGTILANPIIGLGMGQFVINMQTYSNLKLSPWELQPVHNVFLLIWSELGIIGLIIFMLFLWKLFRSCLYSRQAKESNTHSEVKCSTWNNNTCEIYNPIKIVPRGTITNNFQPSQVIKGLLLGLFFIMLFDHYPWDIQQGQLILWIAFAFLCLNRGENLR
jgi:O-antigen ligase